MSFGKYKLARIEWLDTYGCSPRWTEVNFVKPQPMKCISIGWITYEDKDIIVVIPHLSQEDHSELDHFGCGDMTIPKCAITKKKYIKI